MSERIKKQSQLLGMPFSTASARLKKIIFFSLVKKCGEDICFKCRNQIDDADDLSIEHKQPWENRSADLFWDLENITFSHVRCNRPHVYKGGRKSRENPEGKMWCAGHQAYLPVDSFYKKSSTVTGYQVNCKSCHDIKRGRKVSGD